MVIRIMVFPRCPCVNLWNLWILHGQRNYIGVINGEIILDYFGGPISGVLKAKTLFLVWSEVGYDDGRKVHGVSVLLVLKLKDGNHKFKEYGQALKARIDKKMDSSLEPQQTLCF